MAEIEWTYVTRDFETISGEAAKALIEKTNDRRYLTRDAGVHTVSVDRWKLAQDAELHHWLGVRAHMDEDRNVDHAYMYDRYSALQGRTFENAIELGCVPFTNMRVIGQVCTMKRVSLLDPLAEGYLKHPHCAYREGTLTTLNGNVVPVAELIALPIEQFQPKESYDLVVMLNVIEHCYNVPVIFRKIWDMTRPGGLVLFHDRYYDHEQVIVEAERTYDAAHPLKVDRKMINGFLQRFQGVFFRVITTHGFTQHSGTGDQVYFIGVKPETA